MIEDQYFERDLYADAGRDYAEALYWLQFIAAALPHREQVIDGLTKELRDKMEGRNVDQEAA